jgi:predicted RNase H-like nuclease (RuvC/YqgF family)
MQLQTELSELHAEHDEWQDKIRSYRHEIHEMNTSLEEIVSKNPSTEDLVKVEHFQNQLIRQREVLDILRHNFKQHENLIEAKVENQNLSSISEQRLMENHKMYRHELYDFEKIFNDLKEEFDSFAAKV